MRRERRQASDTGLCRGENQLSLPDTLPLPTEKNPQGQSLKLLAICADIIRRYWWCYRNRIKLETNMPLKTKQIVAGNARGAGCPRGAGAAPWRFLTIKLMAHRHRCKVNQPEKPEPGSENEKCFGHVPLYDYLAVFAEDPVWRSCQ